MNIHSSSLDYHYYAEYIVETLNTCGKSYFKLQDNLRAIQYTTEALEYDRKDGNTLICRAKAFENEKW